MDLEQPQSQSQSQPQPTDASPRLVDIVITDQNVSLNVIISFLHLAQRRGAFTFDESAKILECIKMFK